MPLKNMGRTLLLSAALGLLAACGSGSQGEVAAVDTQAAINTNQTGTDGGMFYSFWTNGQGSVNMTLDGSNGYSVQWSNVGDFTAGKGWRNGSSHTVNFSGSYTNSGGGGFGIYGWTTNPLIEYYIVEKPGQTGSPGQGTQVGTLTSDGSTYTIWKHQQVNQPCITGNNCTFWQYISVRQSARTSGTITIANHFKAWAAAGMNLGSHDYQILLTESWNGSGNASAKISEGSGGGGDGGGGGTCAVANGAIKIAAGSSSAVSGFCADQYSSGGSTYNNSNTVDVSQITTNPPPASLFNNERYGAMTYTIPGFTPGGSYAVTLYFAETYLSSAGSRVFNVSINNTPVLSNFDIYAAAGGQNKGIARTFTATANGSGQIAIAFASVTENPKINGISIQPGTGGGGDGGGGGTGTGTVAIAAGSTSAVGSFAADQYSSGGSTYNNTHTVSTSAITSNAPPATLFNNERYGSFGYTIPGLTAGAAYTVTLYFAETYLSSAGSRVFDVSVNGSPVLCSFDIYSAAGGQDRAIARSFNATANGSGQIAVQFSAITENPKVNGILVAPGSNGSSATCTPGGGGGGGGTTTCSGYVGITFDDGPGGNTQALINALKSANLTPVTFFNIGQNVASNSALVQQELAVGTVQNHSYTHQHMTSWGQSQIQDELNRTNQAIQNAGAPKPTLFRLPYGESSSAIQAAAQAAGVYAMTWDVDSQDWNGASTASIVAAANRLQNGQVILMHDAYPNTTNQAIPQIAANLKAKGLCPGKIVNGRAVAP